jgi:hypothetical protein
MIGELGRHPFEAVQLNAIRNRGSVSQIEPEYLWIPRITLHATILEKSQAGLIAGSFNVLRCQLKRSGTHGQGCEAA